jgi:hypothetical protein
MNRRRRWERRIKKRKEKDKGEEKKQLEYKGKKW